MLATFRASVAKDLRRGVALRRRRRRGARRRRVARRALAFAVMVAALLAPPAIASARTTYVSLTFDDATSDQMPALPILASHRMHGTFYVPDGKIGTPNGRHYYMNWDQVDQVAARGHEIGGHTVHHVSLKTLTPARQAQEICNDRQALLARGYDVTSFAYPYASLSSATRAAVQRCGYTSARTGGGVACPNCPASESLPALDRYALRSTTAAQITSVDEIKAWITRAQRSGGGWLIIGFHNICARCGPGGFGPAKLTALLDWMQTERANHDLLVATVAEAAQLRPYAPPANLLQNGSLESGLSAAGPTCWTRAYNAGASGGGSVGAWSDTSDSYSGANAEKVAVSSFVDGDRKLISEQDTPATRATWKSPPIPSTTLLARGMCPPPGIPGHVYQVSAWYKTSTSANARMLAYYRDQNGVWQFWREQPLRPTTSWSHPTWTTPRLPAGATALGAGFSLRSLGTAVVDDLLMGDVSG